MKNEKYIGWILIATLFAAFIGVVGIAVSQSLNTPSVIMAPGAPGVDYPVQESF